MRHALSVVRCLVGLSILGLIGCDTWEDPPLPGPRLDERNAVLDEARAALPKIEKADEAGAIDYLRSGNVWVRRAAASRLAALGLEAQPQPTPAASELSTDVDETTGRPVPATVDAAPSLNPPAAPSPAVDALIEALDDDDWRVRYKVTQALAAYRDLRATDPLIGALVDSDRKVRLWAFKALRELGEPAWRRMYEHFAPDAPLKDAAFSDESGIRRTLAEVLRDDLRVLGKAGVPVASAMLGHEALEVRRTAAQLLGDLGPDAKDAAAALIQATEHEELETRLSAIRALGKLGEVDPAIKPALEQLSKNENKKVLDEAKKALNEIKNSIKSKKDAEKKKADEKKKKAEEKKKEQ